MGLTAIYARQSKDKRDSLSIDAQINKCQELCKFKGKDFKVYIDKGYSGKNTNRPDYSEIMEDIKEGIVDEVIVYRLDRISRNLLDFTEMIQEFEKYGVSFASATESFDTSSPMGRAMMFLLMIFAQLERETIAERIKDNAMYRASLGRWPGGPLPFGYDKKRVNEDGQSRSVLSENEEESGMIKHIFNWYLAPDESVRSVTIKANSLFNAKKEWHNSTISRILQNLIYASNTQEVYKYFSEHVTDFTLLNQPEEFDGQYGMMYYRKRGEEVKRRKGQKQQEQFVIIGEHKGIIPGDIWVRVQNKLESNKVTAPRESRGSVSWLTGILRCGVCGGPMEITFATKRNIYAVCKRKKERAMCDSKNVRIDMLEKTIEVQIIHKCRDEKFIRGMIAKAEEMEHKSIDPLKNQLQNVNANINEKEKEIDNLISNLKSTKSTMLINRIETELEDIEKIITELNKVKEDITEKLSMLQADSINKQFLISNYKNIAKEFSTASYDEKRIMIRGICKSIDVINGEIEINFF